MKKKERISEYLPTPINAPMPNYAVYVLHGSERVLYNLLLFAAGGIVGLIFYGGLFTNSDGNATIVTYISNTIFFVIIGLLSLKFVMPIVVDGKRRKRLNSLSLQFKDFLTSLSTALSAGLNVNDSLKNAENDLREQYGIQSDIVKEIVLVNQAVKNGVSAEVMLNNLGERSGIAEIEDFSKVFTIAFKSGANIKEVVRRTSELIAERLTISIEIETKLTSNKTQMNVMMLIPPMLMMMLKASSSQFAQGFASFPGVLAISVAIGIFVVAYKMGMKILNVE